MSAPDRKPITEGQRTFMGFMAGVSGGLALYFAMAGPIVIAACLTGFAIFTGLGSIHPEEKP